jgi:hypothetical protein
MPYIPPFDAVRRTLEISTFKGELRVATSYDEFVRIIKQYVALLPVDEAWYLEAYPDVAHGIEVGTVASARQHFLEDGYFEGRLPGPPEVDEAWYLTKYPDVAEGVGTGRIKSATHHFIHDGYKEGRLPQG